MRICWVEPFSVGLICPAACMASCKFQSVSEFATICPQPHLLIPQFRLWPLTRMSGYEVIMALKLMQIKSGAAEVSLRFIGIRILSWSRT
jgi:hypothetical protein